MTKVRNPWRRMSRMSRRMSNRSERDFCHGGPRWASGGASRALARPVCPGPAPDHLPPRRDPSSAERAGLPTRDCPVPPANSGWCPSKSHPHSIAQPFGRFSLLLSPCFSQSRSGSRLHSASVSHTLRVAASPSLSCLLAVSALMAR